MAKANLAFTLLALSLAADRKEWRNWIAQCARREYRTTDMSTMYRCTCIRYCIQRRRQSTGRRGAMGSFGGTWRARGA